MLSALFSCRILIQLNILDRFSKNNQIPYIKRIRPVGAELFHAYEWIYRWTDRHDEASSRFSQLCERA
jgi:hypothetical protein